MSSKSPLEIFTTLEVAAHRLAFVFLQLHPEASFDASTLLAVCASDQWTKLLELKEKALPEFKFCSECLDNSDHSPRHAFSGNFIEYKPGCWCRCHAADSAAAEPSAQKGIR